MLCMLQAAPLLLSSICIFPPTSHTARRECPAAQSNNASRTTPASYMCSCAHARHYQDIAQLQLCCFQHTSLQMSDISLPSTYTQVTQDTAHNFAVGLCSQLSVLSVSIDPQACSSCRPGCICWCMCYQGAQALLTVHRRPGQPLSAGDNHPLVPLCQVTCLRHCCCELSLHLPEVRAGKALVNTRDEAHLLCCACIHLRQL